MDLTMFDLKLGSVAGPVIKANGRLTFVDVVGWFIVYQFGTLQSLTGSLQGRITYREIPVVITGNRYAEYNFCLFWLHNFPVLLRFNILL